MFPADGIGSVVLGYFVHTSKVHASLSMPYKQNTTGRFIGTQKTESTSAPTTRGERGNRRRRRLAISRSAQARSNAAEAQARCSVNLPGNVHKPKGGQDARP